MRPLLVVSEVLARFTADDELLTAEPNWRVNLEPEPNRQRFWLLMFDRNGSVDSSAPRDHLSPFLLICCHGNQRGREKERESVPAPSLRRRRTGQNRAARIHRLIRPERQPVGPDRPNRAVCVCVCLFCCGPGEPLSPRTDVSLMTGFVFCCAMYMDRSSVSRGESAASAPRAHTHKHTHTLQAARARPAAACSRSIFLSVCGIIPPPRTRTH